MTRDPSRWWYALLPFPMLVGLRYGLLWVTTMLLPTAGPSRSEALPVLLTGISAAFVGALVVVAAPLFLLGAILDVRALRTHSSWRAHWGYAALGMLPALGLFVEWVALVSIPSTLGYLALRRRRVGYPMGGGRSAEVDEMPQGIRPSAQTAASRWWYGVVVPPVLELTGRVVTWSVRQMAVLSPEGEPLALLVPMGLVLLPVGLTPVFAASLYFDAKRIRNGAGSVDLEPGVWGVLGLGSLFGLVFLRVSFMPMIALAYLLRRRPVGGLGPGR